MSVHAEQQTGSGSAATVLRIAVLALFAIITAIVAVSFAAHHMRIGFEKEYAEQVNMKAEQLAATCALVISGDEIASDQAAAQTKYASVLPALLINTADSTRSSKIYGLYAYTNGSLTPLLQSSETGLSAIQIPVSEWLTQESGPYAIYESGKASILTPIKDSQGKVVGLFELSETYTFLNTYGNTVERRVLMSVLVSVGAGILLFSIQYIIPAIIGRARRREERY